MFKDFIFWCIASLYSVVGDWGMAILIVTIIFRLIIWPLMAKQTKSSYQMQKMQPKMQEIQTRYANDQARLQQEMQKIYAEHKVNPLAACLPMLLQMPIFIALFQVLQEMGSRTSGTTYEFYNLVSDLTLTPATAFSQGVIVFIPYLILLLIFAICTFLPMILQQRKAPASQQKNQMLIMSGVMSLFMLWIGWSSPAGVLLFWGSSSIISIIQMQVTTAQARREDERKEAEEVEVKPVSVDVERKQKKKRPTKSR